MFAENKKALAFAQYCIGLDFNKPYKRHERYFYRPYRNYYIATVKECETWDLLVQAGYYIAADLEEAKAYRAYNRSYWQSGIEKDKGIARCMERRFSGQMELKV